MDGQAAFALKQKLAISHGNWERGLEAKLRVFFAGVNRWPHSGHSICSESMRRILSGVDRASTLRADSVEGRHHVFEIDFLLLRHARFSHAWPPSRRIYSDGDCGQVLPEAQMAKITLFRGTAAQDYPNAHDFSISPAGVLTFFWQQRGGENALGYKFTTSVPFTIEEDIEASS